MITSVVYKVESISVDVGIVEQTVNNSAIFPCPEIFEELLYWHDAMLLVKGKGCGGEHQL